MRVDEMPANQMRVDEAVSGWAQAVWPDLAQDSRRTVRTLGERIVASPIADRAIDGLTQADLLVFDERERPHIERILAESRHWAAKRTRIAQAAGFQQQESPERGVTTLSEPNKTSRIAVMAALVMVVLLGSWLVFRDRGSEQVVSSVAVAEPAAASTVIEGASEQDLQAQLAAEALVVLDQVEALGRQISPRTNESGFHQLGATDWGHPVEAGGCDLFSRHMDEAPRVWLGGDAIICDTLLPYVSVAVRRSVSFFVNLDQAVASGVIDAEARQEILSTLDGGVVAGWIEVAHGRPYPMAAVRIGDLVVAARQGPVPDSGLPVELPRQLVGEGLDEILTWVTELPIDAACVAAHQNPSNPVELRQCPVADDPDPSNGTQPVRAWDHDFVDSRGYHWQVEINHSGFRVERVTDSADPGRYSMRIHGGTLQVEVVNRSDRPSPYGEIEAKVYALYRLGSPACLALRESGDRDFTLATALGSIPSTTRFEDDGFCSVLLTKRGEARFLMTNQGGETLEYQLPIQPLLAANRGSANEVDALIEAFRAPDGIVLTTEELRGDGCDGNFHSMVFVLEGEGVRCW